VADHPRIPLGTASLEGRVDADTETASESGDPASHIDIDAGSGTRNVAGFIPPVAEFIFKYSGACNTLADVHISAICASYGFSATENSVVIPKRIAVISAGCAVSPDPPRPTDGLSCQYSRDAMSTW
jgi:hypothetical protein